MDDSEYEQPDRFWPERFLDENLDKPIKGHLAFGAGKSRGPGISIVVLLSNALPT